MTQNEPTPIWPDTFDDRNALKDVPLEQKIIGEMIVSGRYADDICSRLTAEMFTDDDLRLVFTACKRLTDRGITPDFLLLDKELKAMCPERQLTMRIMEASARCTSAANWEAECAALTQTYMRRELFYKLVEITPTFKAFDADVFEQIDTLQATLNAVVDSTSRYIPERDLSAIVEDMQQQIFDRIKCRERGTMPGVNTGIASLNKATMGWQPSDLCILAGRPSMGKTAVALHMAKTAAGYGSHVVFFSLEMSDTRLAQRLVLSECDVPPEAVRSGELTAEQSDQVFKAGQRIKSLPMTIIEKSGIEIGELCRRAKSLHRNGKCDIVFVDYLQLVTVSRSERVGNREQEVALVSRRLKALAKDLRIPVVALAQLSREVESSASKDSKHLPSLRHLRESGAIEQDADIVSFVYRPAYYGIDTWDDGRETLGRGFILIGKNRDGELGACEFRHNPELTKIFDPPRVGAATPGVFPESKDVFLDKPPF